MIKFGRILWKNITMIFENQEKTNRLYNNIGVESVIVQILQNYNKCK